MDKLYVSNKNESARIFKSDFLETFTKVHWSVPLWIFVPVILYFFYRSYFVLGLGVPNIIMFAIAGLLFWTLTEYILHRFVFHFKPRSKIGKRIIFMFHGVHHDYPNDALRLVMPPSVSIPLAILFYMLFRSFLGSVYVAPFYVGFVTGYLCYDITHYALHHFHLRKKFLVKLMKHHAKHHYQNPNLGYGVSQTLWDHVFRTGFDQERTNMNNRKA